MPPAARIAAPSCAPSAPLHSSRVIASRISPSAFSSLPPPSKVRSSVETTSDVSWSSVLGMKRQTRDTGVRARTERRFAVSALECGAHTAHQSDERTRPDQGNN